MSDPSSPLEKAPLSDGNELQADAEFLSDLAAAARFKTFLVGRGRPVSLETSVGLGKLFTEFSEDLEDHERKVQHQHLLRNRIQNLLFWR